MRCARSIVYYKGLSACACLKAYRFEPRRVIHVGSSRQGARGRGGERGLFSMPKPTFPPPPYSCHDVEMLPTPVPSLCSIWFGWFGGTSLRGGPNPIDLAGTGGVSYHNAVHIPDSPGTWCWRTADLIIIMHSRCGKTCTLRYRQYLSRDWQSNPSFPFRRKRIWGQLEVGKECTTNFMSASQKQATFIGLTNDLILSGYVPAIIVDVFTIFMFVEPSTIHVWLSAMRQRSMFTIGPFEI